MFDVALRLPLENGMTFMSSSVQTRCIVKGEAQKNPIFWSLIQFSGVFWGFLIFSGALFSRNSTTGSFKFSTKSLIF